MVGQRAPRKTSAFCQGARREWRWLRLDGSGGGRGGGGGDRSPDTCRAVIAKVVANQAELFRSQSYIS
jgi:hypothetical protein